MLPASGTVVPPSGTRLRRRLIIAGGVVAGLVVLAVIGVLVVYPRVGVWMVESKVIPRLEAKLGRDVTVGSIEVGRGHAVLKDLVVRGPHDGAAPLARIDRIDVDFDFWESLLANPVIGAVVIDGVTVAVRRGADGADNVRDVLVRLGVVDDGGPDAASAGGDGMGSLRPTKIELRRGVATVVDEGTGATAAVERFDGEWQRGGAAVVRATGARADTGYGPSASAAAVTATADGDARRVEASGGELSLWPGMSLTGITGAVAPGDGGRFVITAEGGYGGVEGRLWTASGSIDPVAAAATLDLDAERFTLDRLRPVIEHLGVIAYEQASIDARLHVDATAAGATFAGGFHVRDLSVDHPMLAEKPVHGLELGGEIAGDFDRDARTLTLTRADLSSRGLPFSITGFLAAPGGLRADGTRRDKPALDLRLVIPKKPCQEVLAAIPIELVPYLEGFVLTGNFDTDLRVAVDWADIPATRLDGRVGIFGCRGKKAPEDVTRLGDQFEHFVEVERDQWISFLVGPDNPDFVPLADVSPHLLNSLMTTEDSAFMTHRGFIVREFRTALIKNLEAGYFKYGASSITMQLVKNVLLYREKTAARKLQELFLTWFIETKFEKERLFEIYVNVIEYGPGIYGIGPAAWHYFGKHPRDLNPVESAFFSSILPAPKARYDQYCKGTLRRETEGKIQRILGLMLKRGRLTELEHAEAVATPLVFARDGTETEQECMARRKRALKNARPTNPLKK